MKSPDDMTPHASKTSKLSLESLETRQLLSLFPAPSPPGLQSRAIAIHDDRPALIEKLVVAPWIASMTARADGLSIAPADTTIAARPDGPSTAPVDTAVAPGPGYALGGPPRPFGSVFFSPDLRDAYRAEDAGMSPQLFMHEPPGDLFLAREFYGSLAAKGSILFSSDDQQAVGRTTTILPPGGFSVEPRDLAPGADAAAALHFVVANLALFAPNGVTTGSINGREEPAPAAHDESALATTQAVIAVPSLATSGPAGATTATVAVPSVPGPRGDVLGGTDRMVVAVADPRGFTFWASTAANPKDAPAVVVPLAPGRVAEGYPGFTLHRPGVGARESGASLEQVSATDPQAADLLTQLLPFDRESLETAIDQFLDQFDDLDSTLPELPGQIRLIPAGLAVAAALVASDVALRVRRRSRGEEDEVDADADADAVPVRFPGLPGTWSL